METSLFKIDRQSKLPLYDQIEHNLRNLIIHGYLQPGQLVPGEWDLATRYGVSRLTIRRALDELVRQNWLERKQGVGTYVRQPAVASIAASKLSFTEQMRAIGRQPGSRFISQRVTPASDKIAQHLKLPSGEPVFEVTRVRLADGVPILLETACLSALRYPALTEQDWSQDLSLYKLLNELYGVTISAMDHTIKPVMLSESTARHLQAEPGIPALLSEIVAFTPDGTPVEFSWSFSNGDKSEFYFHFQRFE